MRVVGTNRGPAWHRPARIGQSTPGAAPRSV